MKTKLLLTVLWLALSVSGQLQTAQAQQPSGTIAVLYHWKAKLGKLEEYNRYIREVAEPIDAEAGKQGAFVSVTTFVSSKADGPWTHLRVFVLKDKAQLDNLSNALDAATVKLEPDEAKRKKRGEYSATLRDLVSREVVEVLK